MTTPPHLARAFSLGSFQAAVELVRYRQDHPELPLDEIAETLERRFDIAGYDYSAAIGAWSIFESLELASPELMFREMLARFIEYRPQWYMAIPHGREVVEAALTSRQHSCFAAAGLFVVPPNEEVVSWWDVQALSARSDEAAAKLAVGRDAERWSLELERHRLSVLGVAERPRWVAIENNMAGYDIESFEFESGSVFPKFIEVKSTSKSPGEIYLSRNQWDRALIIGSEYYFHVWHRPTRTLAELGVEDIGVHIPADKGAGRWETIKILIEAEAFTKQSMGTSV